MKRYFITLIILLSLTIDVSAQKLNVIISNPTNEQRHELVEIDAQEVFDRCPALKAQFKVINALRQEVAYQMTHDGKLLIDACVRPMGQAQFTLVPGAPRPAKTFVYGQQYPERVDDIAWENDRGAYRLYGPALQRSGERAFGNDVWVKNTPDLEVQKRYQLELSNHQAISDLRKAGQVAAADSLEELTTYHFDHGYGLDCYKVGPSLGCGAPALLDNGTIVFPYCYTDYQILDNGPLRFTVSLTYETKAYHGESITEHRILSLDKGSNFNRQVVWYQGATKPLDIASGVVIHQEDTTSICLQSNYALYADPTDNPSGQNFQIYVGVLFPYDDAETLLLPNPTANNGIYGHALVVKRQVKPGEKITYYWGSAWSKNDCRNFAEWQLRTTQLATRLAQPLKVTIQ